MKIITDNTRKVNFNYYVLQEFESGIVLYGDEVKSLRSGKLNISDSYVMEKNTELWLNNMHISLYKNSSSIDYNPKRARKLLLHKKEINKIAGQIKMLGISVVPLALYFNDRGIIKIRIGIVKGKKLYDKRDSIKKRDWEREKSRITREM